jgi:hypothetical protein
MQLKEGARPVQLGGRETNERRVPSTLQEAYELRDASAILEERDYYQERVYRLRGEESVRRRERSSAEALRAGGEGARLLLWEWVLGRWK